MENKPIPQEGPHPGHFGVWLPCLAALVIAFLYVQAIDPLIIGFYRDDGVYAITAKALAEGKGFTLLNVAGQPAQVKYPILYPLVLVSAWLINPDFPANIPLMLYITIGWAIAGLLLIYYYLHRIKELPAPLALAVMILTAGCSYFILTATALFSESVYLCFSFLALILAERYYRAPSRLRMGFLILASALAFHTRAIGLSLILAIGVWLLVRRRPRQALAYLASTLLLTMLPWAWWTRTRFPEQVSDLNYQLIYTYSNYVFEWTQNYGLATFLSKLGANIASLLESLITAMLLLVPLGLDKVSRWWPHSSQYAWIAGFFVLAWLGLQAALAGKRALRERTTAPLSLEGFYLGFYLMILALWGYPEQMGRFLCVVLPLIWLGIIRSFLPLSPPKAVFVSVLLLLALLPMPTVYQRSVVHIRSRQLHWYLKNTHQSLWPEYQEMFDFINRYIPDRETIAAHYDTVFYLYTGNAGYCTYDFRLKDGQGMDTAPDKAGEAALAAFQKYRIAYLVVEPERSELTPAFKTMLPTYLISRYPERFHLVHVTPGKHLKLYRILSPLHQPASGNLPQT